MGTVRIEPPLPIKPKDIPINTAKHPLTIVYSNAKNLAANAIAEDGSIDPDCQSSILYTTINKLFVTDHFRHLPISAENLQQKHSDDIDQKIKDGEISTDGGPGYLFQVHFSFNINTIYEKNHIIVAVSPYGLSYGSAQQSGIPSSKSGVQYGNKLISISYFLVVEGKAKLKTSSVAWQKHYAEDMGKSKEEIAKITKPKESITIVADGVIVK
ncbi:hypothetical protein FQR65_LT19429 [Abscondita terminalis]|nr:hypothetical protein FQR65_LT19429 [Abscondita terminalis]